MWARLRSVKMRMRFGIAEIMTASMFSCVGSNCGRAGDVPVEITNTI